MHGEAIDVRAFEEESSGPTTSPPIERILPSNHSEARYPCIEATSWRPIPHEEFLQDKREVLRERWLDGSRLLVALPSGARRWKETVCASDAGSSPEFRRRSGDASPPLRTAEDRNASGRPGGVPDVCTIVGDVPARRPTRRIIRLMTRA